MNADLRGLLNEIAGDCRVAYGVTEESYRAYCRNGAMGTFPADTWAVHCQRRLGQIEQALASLSVAQGQGFVMVPRGNIESLIRELESPVGCYTGAIAKKLRYLLAAAPAQPDGVSK